MKIKKGDNVIVLTGKNKGKTGVISRAMPKDDMVIIEGVNTRKKHQKASQAGAAGQVIEFSAPIHVSNVAILDPKSKTATRVGKKLVGDKYVRFAKKSGLEV